ncbi:HAD-IA family hydrolase [Streptomyces sp. NPDC101191]|uniref:HAD-IA family hydrolase n=1 Tax=Streptomyces sp. NPDC101191 TaxID=3366126 RepID=UPI0038257925
MTSELPLHAVLFDMDGTLVDTEGLWWEAVEQVAGRPLTDADRPDVLGRPVEHTAAWLAAGGTGTGTGGTPAGAGSVSDASAYGASGGHAFAYGASASTEGASATEAPASGTSASATGAPATGTSASAAPAGALAAALHREFADRVRAGVVPRPGALALLSALARDGVPTALVTASPRSVADIVLDALGALGAPAFAVSVTADDTARTKPEPDPYLAACRALGVEPARCVAVEDTPTGVASAEAAGCAVLAVPSVTPIGPAPGRTVLPGLTEVTPERLRAMAGRHLTVMSWNLWLGGALVEDHRARQLAAIRAAGADVVGLQETGGTATRELAEALGWHHHQAGENLGILSRHPVLARLGDPHVGFYGAAGVRVLVDGEREVDVWTAHLHPTPYGPYEAAFDGLPAEELIAHEGVRLAQMRDTLRRMAEDAGEERPVVLVGDFNAPSHLDRPDVAWPVTKAAEEAGLRDSYREAHPDPAREPGHTWSPIHPVHPEEGGWAGRPEPQDRIDYVLHNARGLRVLASRTLVTGTPAPWPDVAANAWPSDHAAVVTTFAL